MTIVAVGSFSDFNLIVADAIVRTTDDVSSPQFRLCDKLREYEDYEVFCTVVGDESILHALEAILLWFQHNKNIFEFKNLQHIEYVADGASRYREMAQKEFPKMPSPQDTNLYIAGRDDIIWWKIKYDGNINAFKVQPPFQSLKKGTLRIDYGGNCFGINPVITIKNAVHKSINEINRVHKRYNALGYDPDNRYSSAIIPHDCNNMIRRGYPYRFVSDIFVGQFVKSYDLLEASEHQWLKF